MNNFICHYNTLQNDPVYDKTRLVIAHKIFKSGDSPLTSLGELSGECTHLWSY